MSLWSAKHSDILLINVNKILNQPEFYQIPNNATIYLQYKI